MRQSPACITPYASSCRNADSHFRIGRTIQAGGFSAALLRIYGGRFRGLERQFDASRDEKQMRHPHRLFFELILRSLHLATGVVGKTQHYTSLFS